MDAIELKGLMLAIWTCRVPLRPVMGCATRGSDARSRILLYGASFFRRISWLLFGWLMKVLVSWSPLMTFSIFLFAA